MTITPNQMRFTFSDTIAGYVTGFDRDTGIFTLRTSGGQEYPVRLKGHTYAWFVRNLGEPYHDATGQMREMLIEGTLPVRLRHFLPRGQGLHL